MIYITGDTHGDYVRFMEENMPGERSWGEKDVLIICGDFGFVFLDSPRENQILDMLAEKPYTICFCDGNHENFPRLYQYPLETWQGGQVHRVRRNIFHLMRGQIYNIQGSKFLTMGGAYSIDKYTRVEGLSWWPQELPNREEYRVAGDNVAKHRFKVDYVISHTAPREIIRRMGEVPDAHDLELTGFLEWIMYEVSFEKWFFGHWHRDRQIGERFRAVYYDVISL